jgi:hypothetical protein
MTEKQTTEKLAAQAIGLAPRPIPLRASAPPNGDLPDHRQKQVEAGLATYQSVLTERDVLDQKLREALTTIDGLKVQLNSLQGIINMMESTYLSMKLDLEKRVQQYQEERDRSVARAASFETTISNVFAVLVRSLEEHNIDGPPGRAG